jgi:acyl carrier protein
MMVDKTEALRDIIAASLKLSVDRIGESFCMEEADEWDSLAHMELIAALEQIYNIEFTLDEIVEMTTFESITKILADR